MTNQTETSARDKLLKEWSLTVPPVELSAEVVKIQKTTKYAAYDEPRVTGYEITLDFPGGYYTFTVPEDRNMHTPSVESSKGPT